MKHARGELQKIVLKALRKAAPEDAPALVWPLVCGSAVAAKTRAREVSGGVLTVEVGDAAWKSQLQELAPRYLGALQELAPGQVKRIEFVVAPKQNGGAR